MPPLHLPPRPPQGPPHLPGLRPRPLARACAPDGPNAAHGSAADGLDLAGHGGHVAMAVLRPTAVQGPRSPLLALQAGRWAGPTTLVDAQGISLQMLAGRGLARTEHGRVQEARLDGAGGPTLVLARTRVLDARDACEMGARVGAPLDLGAPAWRACAGMRELHFAHLAQAPTRAVRAWLSAEGLSTAHPLALGDLFEACVAGPDLAPDEAVRLGRVVVRALALQLVRLHALGVVHNDIKLENVLVLADGRVSLDDFEHAFVQGEAPGLGTPETAAPEALFEDDEPDIWARDIFSLGTVLLTMLSGCGGMALGDASAAHPPALGEQGALDARHQYVRTAWAAYYEDVLAAAAAAAQQNIPAPLRDLLPSVAEMQPLIASLEQAMQRAPELTATWLAMLHPDPAERPSAAAVADQLGQGLDVAGEAAWAQALLRRRLAPHARRQGGAQPASTRAQGAAARPRARSAHVWPEGHLRPPEAHLCPPEGDLCPPEARAGRSRRAALARRLEVRARLEAALGA